LANGQGFCGSLHAPIRKVYGMVENLRLTASDEQRTAFWLSAVRGEADRRAGRIRFAWRIHRALSVG
jgi:hypothetical protein